MVQEFNEFMPLYAHKQDVQRWLKEFSDPMVGIRRFYEVIRAYHNAYWEEVLTLHNIGRFTCLQKSHWNCITHSIYSDMSKDDRAEDWCWLFAGLFVSYPETKEIVKEVVDQTVARKALKKEQRNVKDSIDAMSNTYSSPKEFAEELKRRCNRLACVNWGSTGISVFPWDKRYIYQYRTSERLIRIKKTELTEEMMQKTLDLITERCVY